MENYIFSRYLKLFEALTMELKLELLAKLTESIKQNYKKPDSNKNSLLEQVYGAWSDVDDDKMIQSIYKNRTISDKTINFD